MITIEHYQSHVLGSYDMATDNFMYAIGQEPPNYPMPAIRKVYVLAELRPLWDYLNAKFGPPIGYPVDLWKD